MNPQTQAISIPKKHLEFLYCSIPIRCKTTKTLSKNKVKWKTAIEIERDRVSYKDVKLVKAQYVATKKVEACA